MTCLACGVHGGHADRCPCERERRRFAWREENTRPIPVETMRQAMATIGRCEMHQKPNRAGHAQDLAETQPLRAVEK